MIRPTHAFVRSLVTVAAVILASCSDQSISAPASHPGSELRSDQLNDTENSGDLGIAKDPKDPEVPLPYPAPYAAALREGQFVVCTHRFWPTATYAISVKAAKPEDRYVTTVTVAGGECAVVFDSHKTKGKASITVTSDPSFISYGAVVIDKEGFHDHYPSAPGPQSYVLSGSAGAIVEFYYLHEEQCPPPYQCYPGGHGGGVT